MNLKPFNLAEAFANPERVVTRDGRKVTQLTKFEADNSHCIYAVIDGIVRSFSIYGLYHNGCESKFDLFHEVQTATVWVVVGTNCGNELQSFMFNDENGAKVFIQARPGTTYSKPTPIEIEI